MVFWGGVPNGSRRMFKLMMGSAVKALSCISIVYQKSIAKQEFQNNDSCMYVLLFCMRRTQLFYFLRETAKSAQLLDAFRLRTKNKPFRRTRGCAFRRRQPKLNAYISERTYVANACTTRTAREPFQNERTLSEKYRKFTMLCIPLFSLKFSSLP